ncbi:sulfite exporter TauE/SafE family protein [Nonomuraea sp. NEAU-A123]|uniref:sulfite exporter TauE/SafE family protein n=1 Tax=Nonomuraea sp. NEAU-A123 TaxID=2839649 RepID=UPI001BE3F38B|nr:sulfite exporter TauE/SafE family protein [Nonomuraea sp. NEAU-A123]MBT2225845.1 sulfite exporter TauE/SafE family protein [Nonomuraea sp. NEAU-A123]
MTLWEAVAVFAAGIAAGAINAVVGSGSLITFPALVAIGIDPVVANVSNNIGLVPGSFTGAYGYRAELAGQRERLLRLGPASAIGSLIGGILLLFLDPSVFKVVVPVLIGLSCVLVVVQPKLSGWLSARREEADPHGGVVLWLGVLGAGIYGGYFGAAQGVLLIGLLGSFLTEPLQRVNAAKNVLALIVNGTAAVLFILIAHVDWWAVLAVAVGATLGGFIGAKVGRRIPAPVLRGIIVCVGIVAIVKLVYG